MQSRRQKSKVEGTFMTTCDGAVQEVFLYESCYDILNDPNLTTCRGEGTCVDYSVRRFSICFQIQICKDEFSEILMVRLLFKHVPDWS